MASDEEWVEGLAASGYLQFHFYSCSAEDHRREHFRALLGHLSQSLCGRPSCTTDGEPKWHISDMMDIDTVRAGKEGKELISCAWRTEDHQCLQYGEQ